MQASEEPGHSHRDDGQAHAIACPPQRAAARSGEGENKTKQNSVDTSALFLLLPGLPAQFSSRPDLSARTARGETAAMAVPEYRTAKF
jgi:hypothetical protein